MAQRQLWTDRRSAIAYGLVLVTLPMMGCAHREPGLGLSLSFFNRGTRSLTTKRFDFDGKRGPVPGYLGPGGGGAHMGFMPGDRQGGVPQSVEAEWILHSDEFLDWSENVPSHERYSENNRETYERLWATNPHYIQSVDLNPILTPALIETVRADRLNTQLKMIVVFRDGNIDITAKARKWR